MSRTFVSFPIIDFHKTKLQVLYWLSRFNTFCFLDNHEYDSGYHSYECLIGAGTLKSLQSRCGAAFTALRNFDAANDDWLFGHFGFDLKNETEHLSGVHPDLIQFPDLNFFVPEIVIELGRQLINIGSCRTDHAAVFNAICAVSCPVGGDDKKNIRIMHRIPKPEYLQIIGKLKEHILRGDCYEINFCQEFYAENISIDPTRTYHRLSEVSPVPFAAFYRVNNAYLLCASPERYLKKSGDILLAQPIKGTAARNRTDHALDDQYRSRLFHSSKDRSENVMVVDLVRNDLSKVCVEGSVKVDELYGIYSFPQVHQMISTVSGKMATGKDWTTAIEATFPMGSMTGAPKKKVLELIGRYEKTKRGLFSGAVGYVSPQKDFDFNVVIRSLMYNADSKYLSCQVGSGITFYSDPEKEFEECLWKMEAIQKVLGN